MVSANAMVSNITFSRRNHPTDKNNSVSPASSNIIKATVIENIDSIVDSAGMKSNMATSNPLLQASDIASVTNGKQGSANSSTEGADTASNAILGIIPKILSSKDSTGDNELRKVKAISKVNANAAGPKSTDESLQQAEDKASQAPDSMEAKRRATARRRSPRRKQSRTSSSIRAVPPKMRPATKPTKRGPLSTVSSPRPSTDTKMKAGNLKTAPNDKRVKPLPAGAMVTAKEEGKNCDMEGYLLDHQEYQDNYVDEYLDKKYKECVLNSQAPTMTPPGMPLMPSSPQLLKMPSMRTTDAMVHASLISSFHPYAFDLSGHLKASAAGQYGFLSDNQNMTQTFCWREQEAPPPPPVDHVTMNSTVDRWQSPPHNAPNISSKKTASNSCSSPSGSTIASSIETIEKDTSDDYSPIDLTRASSDDLYKTFLGFDSKLPFQARCKNDAEAGYEDERAKKLSPFSLFHKDPTESINETSSIMRVSPDPMHQPFETMASASSRPSYAESEETPIIDNQMSFSSLELHQDVDDMNQHRHSENQQDEALFMSLQDTPFNCTEVTKMDNWNILSPSSHHMPEHDMRALCPSAHVTPEQPPFFRMESDHNIYNYEAGTVPGHHGSHFETFPWGIETQERDHMDGGNFLVHTVFDEIMTDSQHDSRRTPKRVSFAPAEVKAAINELINRISPSEPSAGASEHVEKKHSIMDELMDTHPQFEAKSKAPSSSCYEGKEEDKPSTDTMIASKRKKRESGKISNAALSEREMFRDRSKQTQQNRSERPTGKHTTETPGDEEIACSKMKNQDLASKKFTAKQDKMWLQHYDDAVSFARRAGHCMIPNTYPQDPPLARWAKRQRHQFVLYKARSRRASLNATRIAMLDAIHFVWDAKAHTWNEQFENLKRSIAEYGSFPNVPMWRKYNPVDSRRNALITWITNQRKQYEKYQRGEESTMDQKKIKILEEIGFTWEDTRFCGGDDWSDGDDSTNKSPVIIPTKPSLAILSVQPLVDKK